MASPGINPSNFVTFQGISLSTVFFSICTVGLMILLCSVIFKDEVRKCIAESSSACHVAGTQQVLAATLSNWFYSEWAVTSVWAEARFNHGPVFGRWSQAHAEAFLQQHMQLQEWPGTRDQRDLWKQQVQWMVSISWPPASTSTSLHSFGEPALSNS